MHMSTMSTIKLQIPKKNYQLILMEKTNFLSAKVQQELQKVLVEAINDAYERGVEDTKERHGT